MISNQEFKTLAEFTKKFGDEETCRKYFESIRFAKGDYCPHCGHGSIMRFSDGKRYRCHKCRRDFTIKTGTLFGESKIPMQKWFIAIYLLTTRKKGISSIELAEQVGVTQATAWFMDHRIRASFKQPKGKLLGVVEVDETYLGGKHKRKDKFRKKHVLMGMTERGGRIRVVAVPNRATETILPTIKKHVHPKATVVSDEASVYSKLPRLGYQWGYVKHGKRHWVRGDISTNSIESFWALFKRNYHGTYHTMSKKHLQRYVDEVCFRFNHRNLPMYEVFEKVTRSVSKSGKMPLKALIA